MKIIHMDMTDLSVLLLLYWLSFLECDRCGHRFDRCSETDSRSLRYIGRYRVVLALAAAVISIVVKEIMYWYTRNAAKKINSGALMADAWHHRSDALSSVGSFVGIFGARMGFPMLDPLASVVICLFVVKAAVDIFRDAISKMTDRSCDQKTVNEMHDCIMNIRGVEGIDLLKTRSFGSKYYVDIEIKADGDKKLWEAHAIAENVHHAIEQQFPLVKHCMVHVNPA